MNRLLGFFIFYMIFIQSNSLLGCTCFGDKSNIKEFWEESKAIFVGKVLSIDTVDLLFNGRGEKMLFGTREKIRVIFQSLVVLKGRKSKQTFTIYTGFGHGDCGFHFEIDREYLVYANGERNMEKCDQKPRILLFTDTCSRTTLDVENEQKILQLFLKSR